MAGIPRRGRDRASLVFQSERLHGHRPPSAVGVHLGNQAHRWPGARGPGAPTGGIHRQRHRRRHRRWPAQCPLRRIGPTARVGARRPRLARHARRRPRILGPRDRANPCGLNQAEVVRGPEVTSRVPHLLQCGRSARPATLSNRRNPHFGGQLKKICHASAQCRPPEHRPRE